MADTDFTIDNRKKTAPPAPNATVPSFAARVKVLELIMQTKIPTINKEIVDDLLACIREQQAALTHIAGLSEHADGCVGMVDFPHKQALRVASNRAKESIAKYALEPK